MKTSYKKEADFLKGKLGTISRTGFKNIIIFLGTAIPYGIYIDVDCYVIKNNEKDFFPFTKDVLVSLIENGEGNIFALEKPQGKKNKSSST